MANNREELKLNYEEFKEIISIYYDYCLLNKVQKEAFIEMFKELELKKKED